MGLLARREEERRKTPKVEGPLFGALWRKRMRMWAEIDRAGPFYLKNNMKLLKDLKEIREDMFWMLFTICSVLFSMKNTQWSFNLCPIFTSPELINARLWWFVVSLVDNLLAYILMQQLSLLKLKQKVCISLMLVKHQGIKFYWELFIEPLWR